MNTTTVTIKNVAKGPRGFNEVAPSDSPWPNRQRVLEPGEGTTATLNDIELEDCRKCGWFEITEETANA